MPAAIALGVIGIWLAVQAAAGRLPARLLSWRANNGQLVTTGAPGPTSSPSASTTPGVMAWPVHGTVTQEFGHNGHPGIDIAAPTGRAVGAATAGTVTQAGWNNGYGNSVIIDHGGGLTTLYGHLSSVAVNVGDRLAGGGLVGAIGSTGHSTGPHLHLEVREGGEKRDPRSFIGGQP